MWNWSHFKAEGWVAHTKRSVKLCSLLLLSGAAMAVHILIPFWEQPRFLQIANVARALDGDTERRRE